MITAARTTVCVGAVVTKGAKVLWVRQAPGHSLAGHWTIPWGRLEQGESPSAAAIRETLEEAGVVASLDGFLGSQELPDPWSGWLALLYLCRYESGEPAGDGHETDAAAFVSLAQLQAFGEPIDRFSEWLVQRVVATASDSPNPFDTPGFFNASGFDKPGALSALERS